MAELKFIEGDATQPRGSGNKLIVHCANNRGAWGSGFVIAISKRWQAPERKYRDLDEYKLGAVQFVRVEDEMPRLGETVDQLTSIWVVNIIGQDGIGIGDDGIPPVRYEALRKGFQRAARWCRDNAATAHMPRIGSGLAGGDWALVERLVEVTFLKLGIDVTVYDFPGGKFFDSRTSDE